MKLGNLTSEWRSFTIGSSMDMGGYMSVLSSIMGGGAISSKYYSKGDTVRLAGETFIVANKSKIKSPSMADIMKGGNTPPSPDKISADTQPLMSLVYIIKTAGSIKGISPFNFLEELKQNAQDIADVSDASTQAETATSTSNLKHCEGTIRDKHCSLQQEYGSHRRSNLQGSYV